jgi:hypothetical protein
VGHSIWFIFALLAASIPSLLATQLKPFHHHNSALPNAAKLIGTSEIAFAT